MKKILSILLSVLMLISVSATAALAGNGPSPAWMPGEEDARYYFAYATFIEYADSGMPAFDEHGMFTYKHVFSNNEVLNEAPGAVYDRATNTLTLTDFNQPNYNLELNMMGDDFKIKVVGDCALASIVAFGDGWGGSVTLTGNGTLSVNGKLFFRNAVTFYPEGADIACLTVDPEVSIHLYSKEAAVCAENVDKNEKILALSREATEPVTFKTEQRVEDKWHTIDVIDASEGPEDANMLRYNYKDDAGDGIWCGTPTKWYQDEVLIKEGYTVYHLVWNESLGAWIADIETPRTLGYEWGYLDLSTEEFNDMGFTIAKNGEGKDDWSEIRMYRDFATNNTVMTDGENKYVSVWVWDPEKEESFQHYYTFKPVPGVEGLMITDQLADVKEEDLVVDMLKVPVEGVFTKYTENKEIHIGKDAPVVKPGVSFTDVPAGEYYYDAVAWAVENNITAGTGATTFSPNMACSRSQVVTFLWRSVGEPEPADPKNPFVDVKEGDWYYKAVLWAVERGITVGTSATTFSPDSPCTRSQIVTFLYRWKGEPEPKNSKNPFSDVKSSDFFLKPVLWAVENNITLGTSATTFSPVAVCTRSQVVTFMYRGK